MLKLYNIVSFSFRGDVTAQGFYSMEFVWDVEVNLSFTFVELQDIWAFGVEGKVGFLWEKNRLVGVEGIDMGGLDEGQRVPLWWLEADFVFFMLVAPYSTSEFHDPFVGCVFNIL